ncbi:hypothetical protein GCM10009416_13170 [Craurococcus roseus]|uniref:Uncharacterized protein n=1 Tax=Craurococcus roseus TaxID=77585 RepID=A0ABN1EW76_9PROT
MPGGPDCTTGQSATLAGLGGAWGRPDYPICCIARTAEAKAAGIRMGDPWHLARNRPEVRAARVEWFSSNYAL